MTWKIRKIRIFLSKETQSHFLLTSSLSQLHPPSLVMSCPEISMLSIDEIVVSLSVFKAFRAIVCSSSIKIQQKKDKQSREKWQRREYNLTFKIKTINLRESEIEAHWVLQASECERLCSLSSFSEPENKRWDWGIWSEMKTSQKKRWKWSQNLAKFLLHQWELFILNMETKYRMRTQRHKKIYAKYSRIIRWVLTWCFCLSCKLTSFLLRAPSSFFLSSLFFSSESKFFRRSSSCWNLMKNKWEETQKKDKKFEM